MTDDDDGCCQWRLLLCGLRRLLRTAEQRHGEPRFYVVEPTQTKVETIWFPSGIQALNSMTEFLSFMQPLPAQDCALRDVMESQYFMKLILLRLNLKPFGFLLAFRHTTT